VGVISAGDYFFPHLLVEFASCHRNVTLNFTVHNRAGLLTHIADNLTDLAIMVRPPNHLDTRHQPFAPHPYVIVAAPGHSLVAAKNIILTTLMREQFMVREKGSDTWHSMVEGFGGHLGDIRIAMEIPSTETIKQAVIAGMGVSFLSAYTISRELKAGSLRVLDVRRFPLALHWYVVHCRIKRLPPVAQAFKDFLLSDGGALISKVMPLDPSIWWSRPACPTAFWHGISSTRSGVQLQRAKRQGAGTQS